MLLVSPAEWGPVNTLPPPVLKAEDQPAMQFEERLP